MSDPTAPSFEERPNIRQPFREGTVRRDKLVSAPDMTSGQLRRIMSMLAKGMPLNQEDYGVAQHYRAGRRPPEMLAALDALAAREGQPAALPRSAPAPRVGGGGKAPRGSSKPASSSSAVRKPTPTPGFNPLAMNEVNENGDEYID